MDLESLLSSAGKKVTYALKWLRNKPDDFTLVEKDSSGNYIPPKGYFHVQEVGEVEDQIFSLVYHKARDVVRCHLTTLRDWEGKDIDAVHVVREEYVGGDCGKVRYQPLRLIVERSVINL